MPLGRHRRCIDPNGDPRAEILELTPDAKASWVVFYNEHNRGHVLLADDLAAANAKLEVLTMKT